MNNNNDDEFGDSSFLDDIDVDQVLQQSQPSANKRAKIEIPVDEFGEDDAFFENLENFGVPAGKPAAATATSSSAPTSSSSPTTDPIFQRTLESVFGYTHFRAGQEAVLQAVAQKRDVAVFWSTGSGKSLCYQIPALAFNQVVLVVSPLISLMQDQTHKINGLSRQPVATFLGSGQTDPMAETKALRGDFNLIYLTPEKFTGSFLSQLGRIKDRIGLVAIDEAHCVSEWGHDFRSDFRKIGDALSATSFLSHVPIMALTATAVPRVQTDIIQCLRLRNPYVALSSFDRNNLKITVASKTGGMQSTLLPLVKELQQRPTSTIVYAPTRDLVQQLATFLQENLKNTRVQAYHAGMSTEARSEAHTNFLTGVTTIIVATVAFGMGIDKPDTRRIVHFGPPKTMEEYYQQIGRAGRDGRPAECVMFMTRSDFESYKSDFYLGNLTGNALDATVKSMDALLGFSMDVESCRRKMLLDYFCETPPFGERCGTCDNCMKATTFASDMNRDFGPIGARVVLAAVSALNKQGLTQVLLVIGGKEVESYRYASGRTAAAVKRTMEELCATVPKEYPKQFYRELAMLLVQKGFLSEEAMKKNVNGFDRTWNIYQITVKGIQALGNKNIPIVLPVPDCVREVERKQEERRQKIFKQLEEKGIKLENLPVEEVEKGDGECVRAYTKWFNYLEKMRDGREDRLVQLEALLADIESWRSKAAVQYRMAPGSVLPDHLLYSIAYTQASMSPGCKLDSASLSAAGVRSNSIDELVQTLSSWVDRVQPAKATDGDIVDESDEPLKLDAHVMDGAKAWSYAIYKPNKKTGKATWELSYDRFVAGESPESIAISPASGRPIQVKTVVGHLLDAIEHGKKVDLQRLVFVFPPPSTNEWKRFEEVETTTGMDVAGDPETSGLNGQKFSMTEFLRPIVGDSIADKPFNERSEEEKQVFSTWCDRLKWYMALRRAGFNPKL